MPARPLPPGLQLPQPFLRPCAALPRARGPMLLALPEDVTVSDLPRASPPTPFSFGAAALAVD
eukprot:9268766-Lingulodinium_polyedra.AAC.1